MCRAECGKMPPRFLIPWDWETQRAWQLYRISIFLCSSIHLFPSHCAVCLSLRSSILLNQLERHPTGRVSIISRCPAVVLAWSLSRDQPDKIRHAAPFHSLRLTHSRFVPCHHSGAVFQSRPRLYHFTFKRWPTPCCVCAVRVCVCVLPMRQRYGFKCRSWIMEVSQCARRQQENAFLQSPINHLRCLTAVALSPGDQTRCTHVWWHVDLV